MLQAIYILRQFRLQQYTWIVHGGGGVKYPHKQQTIGPNAKAGASIHNSVNDMFVCSGNIDENCFFDIKTSYEHK